ncbi:MULTISPECIES: type II secretion system protein GspM [unclassified Pseudomonas]|uniref:type II secretion system protein GspM n=1 Tax=unclassified Pseudomonas TaxID=196821 RepID=UPI0020984BF9|nr:MULTISPECIES: type II secretion system protein GspM [unclassified Pseudomonas]MCO7519493.1 type II secretion system protein GspM [Pseudomonas sp. 1]MCO7542235.1 type II secretion system protein GspM [Pseudomonas sp. VA159-2]
MNRQWLRRQRLPLAWGVVALLLVVLALREGLGYWRDVQQWRVVAESVAGLREPQALSLERLRQSAQARGIGLDEIQAEGERWQVRGKVTQAQALQAWLQALREEGAQPLQWALAREADGLRFAVQVRP